MLGRTVIWAGRRRGQDEVLATDHGGQQRRDEPELARDRDRHLVAEGLRARVRDAGQDDVRRRDRQERSLRLRAGPRRRLGWSRHRTPGRSGTTSGFDAASRTPARAAVSMAMVAWNDASEVGRGDEQQQEDGQDEDELDGRLTSRPSSGPVRWAPAPHHPITPPMDSVTAMRTAIGDGDGDGARRGRGHDRPEPGRVRLRDRQAVLLDDPVGRLAQRWSRRPGAGPRRVGAPC